MLLASTSAQQQPSANATLSTGASSSVLLKEATKLYQEGHLDDAIAKFQTVLQQDSKSGQAYAGVARCLLKQEKVQDALDMARKGVSTVPDDPAVHSALGDVLFRKGAIYDADVEWVKAANSARPNARAFWGISRLDFAMSMYAQGKKHIDHAHELDPQDPEIRLEWIGTLRRPDRIRELEKYLADVTDDDPKVREALQRRLQRLKEEGPETNCSLVSPGKHTDIKLEHMMIDAHHLRGYGLSVNINGVSARLLLDTGASGLLINKRIAEKAGIKPVVRGQVSGFGDNGPAEAYAGYSDSIKVGGLEFQHCRLDVAERRSIVGEDGLVGADVFGDFLVTLDFPNEKLSLDELPKRPGEAEQAIALNSEASAEKSSGPLTGTSDAAAKKDAARSAETVWRWNDRYIAPEMKSFTPIYRFGHELLIPTQINDGPARLFMIDTGSVTTLISSDAAAEVTKVHGDPYTTIRGMSGTVKNVKSADNVVLRFGHFRQQNEDLVSFDLSSLSRSTGTEVSGVLGFTVLRLLTMKIDYRDGLVDFKY
ncbi:MAG: aspartyl protease family protein [Acidobacteria bacterium]|nr:aspartyl protease family protein [Acidobacteriota bacterium]